MIVIDASAAVDFLLLTAAGRDVADRIENSTLLHAPELIEPEFMQALRRRLRQKAIEPWRADQALGDFRDLRIRLHGHRFLGPRVWELRDRLSAYDATYVALAESMRAVLLTSDARLARAVSGMRLQVQLAG